MKKYAVNKYQASSFQITYLGTPNVSHFHGKRDGFSGSISVDLMNAAGDLIYSQLSLYCGTNENFESTSFANRK
ncbi:hypothetical protein CVV68_01445 [Arthrobacter livingstonensis]|uniref:Uncharacterized protein n=1 Tax=Arthrobacter livingstonensis TaxID=670078 RepID=A0A2V5LDU5_9MICC|nr:hypothetical protein CVV68_01445 [Arthrobacter livingstonensis]